MPCAMARGNPSALADSADRWIGLRSPETAAYRRPVSPSSFQRPVGVGGTKVGRRLVDGPREEHPAREVGRHPAPRDRPVDRHLGHQVHLRAGPVPAQVGGGRADVEDVGEQDRPVLRHAVGQVDQADERQREVGAHHERGRDGERQHVHEPGGQHVRRGLPEQVLVVGQVLRRGAHPADHVLARRAAYRRPGPHAPGQRERRPRARTARRAAGTSGRTTVVVAAPPGVTGPPCSARTRAARVRPRHRRRGRPGTPRSRRRPPAARPAAAS